MPRSWLLESDLDFSYCNRKIGIIQSEMQGKNKKPGSCSSRKTNVYDKIFIALLVSYAELP
ncbi:MAG: hypothetical protein C5B59_04655 [Bacteroidetes bacterium]|nr:MAG: hypothetical protein C5B59_04655 [Bacteroidota bacterium]